MSMLSSDISDNVFPMQAKNWQLVAIVGSERIESSHILIQFIPPA